MQKLPSVFGFAILLFVPSLFRNGLLILCILSLAIIFLLCSIIKLQNFITGSHFKSKRINEIVSCHKNILPNNVATYKSKFITIDKYSRTASEIREIIEFIVTDFIQSWLLRIEKDNDQSLPNLIQSLLENTADKIATIQADKNIVDIISTKCIPKITKHINIYKRCVTTEANLKRQTTLHKNSLHLAVEFNKYQKFHRNVSLRNHILDDSVKNYCLDKAQLIQKRILNENEASSTIVSSLVKEILAGSVLYPLINKLINPYDINLQIISMSERILKETKQVSRIRQLLNEETDTSGTTEELINNAKVWWLFKELPINNKQYELSLRYITTCGQIVPLHNIGYVLLLCFGILDDNIDKKASKQRLLLMLNLVEMRLKTFNSKLIYGPSLSSKVLNSKNSWRESTQFVKNFISTITFADIVQQNELILFFEEFLANENNINLKPLLSFICESNLILTPLDDSYEEDQSIVEPLAFYRQLKQFITETMIHALRNINAERTDNIMNFMSQNEPDMNIYFIDCLKSIRFLNNLVENILKQYFEQFKSSASFLNMITSSKFFQTNVYIKGILEFSLRQKSEDYSQENATNMGTKNSRIDQKLESIIFENGILANDLPKRNVEDSTLANALLDNYDKDKSIDDIQLSVPQESKELLFRPGLKSFKDIKEAIADLTLKINQTEKEDEILDHLLLKAELINDKEQLRILSKSKRAMKKDIERMDVARQLLLIQESSNALYGTTEVSISSFYEDVDEGGKKLITFYLVNVKRQNGDKSTSWEVSRRFNEFAVLYKYLHANYSKKLKKLDLSFPSKIPITENYNIAKVDICNERRIKFELFLNQLLQIQEICEDDLFRTFLTNPLSFSINRNPEELPLINNSQSYEFIPELSLMDEGLRSTDDLVYDNKYLTSHYAKVSTSNETKSTVKIISEFFIAIFSSRTNSRWLRGRAIVTLLQQLMGSTIDKYMKEQGDKWSSDSHVSDLLASLKFLLWGPNGTFRRPKVDKKEISSNEKRKVEIKAFQMMQTLFIEQFGTFIGYQRSKEASKSLHEMLQIQYLNCNLVFELFDDIIDEFLLRKEELETNKITM
ncbi:PXA domain profile [Nakaseomyces glabratus]